MRKGVLPPKPDLKRLGGYRWWKAPDKVMTDFWAGGWFRIAYRFTERVLENMVDETGVQSFAYRSGRGRYERQLFEAGFGAVSDERITKVALLARELGAPHDDIRILVLNKLLVVTEGGDVTIRLQWWERALALTPSIFAWGSWGILTLHTLRQSGPVWLKIVVIVVVTAIEVFLWRGWRLYHSGPLLAVTGSGDFIRRANLQNRSREAAGYSRVTKFPGTRR